MEEKHVGERLASIEALLSSQKEGQVRIERSLEKTSDELAARHTIQDKAFSDLQTIVTKVDHRSANNHLRIDALEVLVHTKIDKSEAVTRVEIEPIKDMLKRIDNHLSWSVKIVVGAVIIAVLSFVLVKADMKAPWDAPISGASSHAAPRPGVTAQF